MPVDADAALGRLAVRLLSGDEADLERGADLAVRRGLGGLFAWGLEARGIAPERLGAAARDALAVWPRPAFRPAGDLDLLVEERSFDAAVEALCASGYRPTVEAILGIAVNPVSGDVYVEVRGTGAGVAGGQKNRYLLNVDAHDRSCRHAAVVQQDLRTVSALVPSHFGTTDGRIVMTPRFRLLRLVPSVDSALLSVTTYTIMPPEN